jgi:hypothetical protein
MTAITWTRSPERSVWVAEAGSAVLTVCKRADRTWAAQARWTEPERSATQYGFRTRLQAHAWAERQVTP